MADRQRKKVLIWESLPSLGGGQRVSIQIGLSLRESGIYDVEYLAPAEGAFTNALKEHAFIYQCLPLRYYSLGQKSWKDYLAFLLDGMAIIAKFINLQRKKHYKVLYIGGTKILPWGAILGQMLTLDVIWHIHHVFNDRKTLRLLETFGRLACVKKLICVSETVKNQFSGLNCKAAVIYNGVEVDRFSSQTTGHLFSELGMPSESIIITMIGALQPVKRHDILIKALPCVLEKWPNTLVLIAGEKRTESEAYAQKLKWLVSSLNLKKYVIFLGNRNDIPDILANTALVIVAGEEGFPLAVLESCAAGVPVICPDIAGAAEAIAISKAGETHKYGNDRHLAEVIIKILRSTELQKKYANNGRTFANEHSIEKFRHRIIHEMKIALNDQS